jgi:hypothetical protein
MRKEKGEKRDFKLRNLSVFLLIFGILFSVNLIFAATPENPAITSVNNSTRTTSNSGFFNISGGYVSTMNLDATFQNTRWKAMVGNVTGKYTLDDAAGQTIFDWTFATITGRVYSTRDSGTIEWASISCADDTEMANENSAMFHSNQSTDNLTRTFNRSTHTAFYAAGNYIGTNACDYGVVTYVNDAPQGASPDFEEIVLHDGTSIVYATILEDNAEGYDTAKTFDFQMIVPENGTGGFTGATAYYIYVELD